MASLDQTSSNGAVPDALTDCIRVICINYEFDRLLTSPAALLERYETLVEWTQALATNGAHVSVIQRFRSDSETVRNGVLYRFVRDRVWYRDGVPDRPKLLHDAVVQTKPDIVHINGLQFGRQARHLKSLLRSVPVILQDHANIPPRNWLKRWILRRALLRLDAFSFVSREQARPWLEGGFLHKQQTIVELMEASSRFRLKARAEVRARTGLYGNPVCLWVGRLNDNKDPLTILRGFAKALPAMPNARLAMVYHTEDLLPSIRTWLRENPLVSSNVIMLGHLDHAALEDLYNSADLFLLGSHHEGSGYAVLEALACGVMPILTDIPSFRVLTGGGTVGKLWQIGNADQLAGALVGSCQIGGIMPPQEVRAFFEKHFSWSAVGNDAMRIYRELINHKERRAN